jgi:hypothetical protein
MQTQAYFEDIKYYLKRELNTANQSIKIAVAWFTDSELFEVLVSKTNDGVCVELILNDDDINNGCSIDFDRLNFGCNKIYKVGRESKSLMHNKFCIIDSNTIITGSYNWSYKAQSNYENITIIKDAPELANQFLSEFVSLMSYFAKADDISALDFNKISIRLENLKNAIIIEDREDITHNLGKLRNSIPDVHIDDNILVIRKIIDLIKYEKYGDAVSLINNFVSTNRQLSVYIDSEISALRLEIKALEIQISSLADEKAEIEKLIYSFEIRHNQELGELILKILENRREKLKAEAEEDSSKQDDYEEAEKDYSDFQNNFNETIGEKIFEISDEERIELKTNFRKASKLCHPDTVNEENKKEAERIFNDLKIAYDHNDLEKVNEILNNLEKGYFTPSSDTDEKEQLRAIISKLHRRREEISTILNELKASETYMTISGIENWTDYFEKIKMKLQNELKTLNDEE